MNKVKNIHLNGWNNFYLVVSLDMRWEKFAVFQHKHFTEHFILRAHKGLFIHVLKS